MSVPIKSPLRAGTHRGANFATGMAGSDAKDASATGSVKGVHDGDTETGERASGCGRGAPAPDAAALPCLNRNNSISAEQKPARRYRFKPVGNTGLLKDRDGVFWAAEEGQEGHHYRLGGQPFAGADRKRAFILRRHVEAFVKYWGRNRSLFFTTTDGEGVQPRTYARRWNSLLANESAWLAGFIRVLEPQRNGRPHFHNLTAVPFDTKPDEFDWEAFSAAQNAYYAKDWPTFRAMRERYKTSATPELRELWAWGREKMVSYGLGRCEILPIRKEGAIAEYIGKYLDKGMCRKIDAWKGVRRFETDRRTSADWKRCGRLFSWVSPGAAQWRARCRSLALAIGLADSGDPRDLTQVLGPRWAYSLRGAITTGSDEEFRAICEALAEVARRDQAPPGAK